MTRDKERNMTYNDLGCWANMRLAFIKHHHPQLYQSLLKENKLYSYLAEFDRQVRDTLILTEEQMRQTEGITEELKRQDQLEWVCRMNKHPQLRGGSCNDWTGLQIILLQFGFE